MPFSSRSRALFNGARRLFWLWLLLIVGFGAALRFTGLRWDEQTHVHPDERFISMVSGTIQLPDSPREYFDVENSRLSPYVTKDFKNYLYGQFPLTLAKFVAARSGRDSYEDLYIVGRALAALADTLSIGLICVAALLLCRPFDVANSKVIARPRWVALTAALCYAGCVLAIQCAHFFTMESWLIFWSLATFCGALWLLRARRRWAVGLALMLCAVALAGAMSCKAQGVLAALPVVMAVVWRWRGRARRERAILILMVGIGATLLFYRVLSPYTFASSSWLDWRPNPFLLDSLRTQASFMNGEAMFPPQYQWLLTRPWISPAYNLLVWATGPFVGVFGVLGLGALAWRTWGGRRANTEAVARIAGAMLLALALAVWFASAGRFVHTVRYLVPVLPLLCLAAAFFAAQTFRSRKISLLLCVVVTLPTALYALAFASIYRRPTPLVAASRFLLDQAPQGATAVGEHWDLVLPLGVDPRIAHWTMRELPVFDSDSDTRKIDHLYNALRGADFFTLASPRAWGTIGRLPGEYPMMVRFYQLLFDGKLGFTEIADFRSPPQLGPFVIPDDSAEESFWVYDHPRVRVFRRTTELSRDEFRALLQSK